MQLLNSFSPTSFSACSLATSTYRMFFWLLLLTVCFSCQFQLAFNFFVINCISAHNSFTFIYRVVLVNYIYCVTFLSLFQYILLVSFYFFEFFLMHVFLAYNSFQLLVFNSNVFFTFFAHCMLSFRFLFLVYFFVFKFSDNFWIYPYLSHAILKFIAYHFCLSDCMQLCFISLNQ